MYTFPSMKRKIPSPSFAMILEHVSTTDSETTPVPTSSHIREKEWHEDMEEGKLSVDVAHDDKNVYIVSTVAGVIPDKIEIYIHNDLLTLRGERVNPMQSKSGVEFYHSECFWGHFSRTIVLPVEVNGDLARAQYKNGVLEIVVPKRTRDRKISVEIVED